MEDHDLRRQIAVELYKAVERLGGGAELRAIVAHTGEPPDEDLLARLKQLNAESNPQPIGCSASHTKGKMLEFSIFMALRKVKLANRKLSEEDRHRAAADAIWHLRKAGFPGLDDWAEVVGAGPRNIPGLTHDI